VNLPYALKAATVTGNANNAEADQSRRNQIEKGDQKQAEILGRSSFHPVTRPGTAARRAIAGIGHGTSVERQTPQPMH
jgi:hypothetical protein